MLDVLAYAFNVIRHVLVTNTATFTLHLQHGTPHGQKVVYNVGLIPGIALFTRAGMHAR